MFCFADPHLLLPLFLFFRFCQIYGLFIMFYRHWQIRVIFFKLFAVRIPNHSRFQPSICVPFQSMYSDASLYFQLFVCGLTLKPCVGDPSRNQSARPVLITLIFDLIFFRCLCPVIVSGVLFTSLHFYYSSFLDFALTMPDYRSPRDLLRFAPGLFALSALFVWVAIPFNLNFLELSGLKPLDMLAILHILHTWSLSLSFFL